MTFSGFPRGVLSTPVPDPLLNSLLEEIDDIVELKVVLRGLWLLHQKRESPRMLSRDELLNDRVLRRGVKVSSGSPIQVIERGLDLAVEHQIFILFQPYRHDREKKFYLVNIESNRRAVSRMRQSGTIPSKYDVDQSEGLADELPGINPNIVVLYEEHIGTTVGPLLAEQLKEAEDNYPWPWICEAFQIAATQNKLRWVYISGILRRWASEGKGDGKLGRYSQKDDRKKYLEEYQRRRGHTSAEPADR
jgi:DnaD/phage-associated family protein